MTYTAISRNPFEILRGYEEQRQDPRFVDYANMGLYKKETYNSKGRLTEVAYFRELIDGEHKTPVLRFEYDYLRNENGWVYRRTRKGYFAFNMDKAEVSVNDALKDYIIYEDGKFYNTEPIEIYPFYSNYLKEGYTYGLAYFDFRNSDGEQVEKSEALREGFNINGYKCFQSQKTEINADEALLSNCYSVTIMDKTTYVKYFNIHPEEFACEKLIIDDFESIDATTADTLGIAARSRVISSARAAYVGFTRDEISGKQFFASVENDVRKYISGDKESLINSINSSNLTEELRVLIYNILNV